MPDNDESVWVEGLEVTPDSVSEDGHWVGEDGMSCDVRDMNFPVP